MKEFKANKEKSRPHNNVIGNCETHNLYELYTQQILFRSGSKALQRSCPKEALERRNSICCVYNYKDYIVSQLPIITLP